MTVVGRVAELYRYPVKSMCAVPEPELALAWHGFAGDREYAFRKKGDLSYFPWLTGRDLSTLVLYRARYQELGDVRKSPVEVIAPDGEVFDVRSEALEERLSRESERPVDLLHMGRGVFDSMPVSVMGRDAFRLVEEAQGCALDILRFRPNIVIDMGDDRDWIDRTLVFGDRENAARLRVNCSIDRCAMITIDPATAARDASVMRTVAQKFGNECGVYCAVERPGMIRVGDTVRLET